MRRQYELHVMRQEEIMYLTKLSCNKRYPGFDCFNGCSWLIADPYLRPQRSSRVGLLWRLLLFGPLVSDLVCALPWLAGTRVLLEGGERRSARRRGRGCVLHVTRGCQV